jgi:PAS domain S-box-containing protein
MGRLRGYGVVTRVSTDRMRAQDLLAVLDAATDAILGVDADGLVMFLNEAAARMFGYSKPELLGQSIEILVPLRHRAAHRLRREGYGSHPIPRLQGGGLDLRAVRRDGSEFPVEVSLSSVDTPRGPVVTALVRDLTGRRAAEAVHLCDDERPEELFEHSPARRAEPTMDTDWCT